MAEKWHPGELLSTSSAYWRGCVLQAAVRLRIFSELAGGACSGDELAAKIGTEARATDLLLQALSGMGLVLKENGIYQNSAQAQEFLVESAPGYLGYIILHHHHLLDGWAQLDRVIRTGEPAQRRSFGEDVERHSFIMGMYNLSMQIAPQISAQIDLSGRKCLLDLGGGPGIHAIHFCQANPGLAAVVFDRPTTEPFARRTIAEFGLEQRIAFVGGDFKADPIGGGPYDVAWMSHIMHSNGFDECCRIVEKCVGVMETGGLLFIHDFILDDDKAGPEFPTLFSLNMLLAGNKGRSYSQQELFDMLHRAGVKQLKRHPFRAKNDSSIVYGIVA